MNFYYTDKAGAVAGPVAREQLQKLVDSGLIAADSQACFEGSEDWKPLSTFVRPTPKPAAAAPAVKPAQSAAATTTPKPAATPSTSASTGSSLSGALTSGVVGVAILSFLAWKLTAIERLLDKKVTPPEFEYMIAAPKDYAFNREMTELGKQGWEVVSARRATSSNEYEKASYEVILKRQIR
jgi:hypothetical protein